MKSQSLLLLIAFSVAGTSFAQQGTSSLSLEAGNSKRASPFHLTADLSAASNLYKADSPEQEGSTDLDLIPSVELTDRISLGARTIISQQQAKSEARDTTVSNTQINLKFKGAQLTKNLASNYILRGIAPTNQVDRKETRYQGGAGAAGNLTFTKGITTLKYTLLGARSFHEYTVNAEGDPNIQYTLTHDLALDLDLTKNLVLSMSGFYKQGWTYKNSGRQTYGYSAGLGYSITKAWSVGASLETEGQALKPNGTDSNIKFYDENTSVVRASVTFTN